MPQELDKDRPLKELRGAVSRGNPDTIRDIAAETAPEEAGALAVEIAKKHLADPTWKELHGVWAEANAAAEKSRSTAFLFKLGISAELRASTLADATALNIRFSNALKNLTLNEETLQDAMLLILFIEGINLRHQIKDASTSRVTQGKNATLKLVTGLSRVDNYKPIANAAKELRARLEPLLLAEQKHAEEKKSEAKDEAVSSITARVETVMADKKINIFGLNQVSKDVVALYKERNAALKKIQLEQKQIDDELGVLKHYLAGWKDLGEKVIPYNDKTVKLVESFYSLTEAEMHLWWQAATVDYPGTSGVVMATINKARNVASQMPIVGRAAPLLRRLPFGSDIAGAHGSEGDLMAKILFQAEERKKLLESRSTQLAEQNNNISSSLSVLKQKHEEIQLKQSVVTVLNTLVLSLCTYGQNHKLNAEKMALLVDFSRSFQRNMETAQNVKLYFILLIKICLQQTGHTLKHKSSLGKQLRRLLNESPDLANLKKEFFGDEPVKVTYRRLREISTPTEKNDDKYFAMTRRETNFAEIKMIFEGLEKPKALPPTSSATYQGVMFPPALGENDEKSPDTTSPEYFKDSTLGICHQYLNLKEQKNEGVSSSFASGSQQPLLTVLMSKLNLATERQQVITLLTDYLADTKKDESLRELHSLLERHLAHLVECNRKATPSRSQPQ
jgi:hypothetical protein